MRAVDPGRAERDAAAIAAYAAGEKREFVLLDYRIGNETLTRVLRAAGVPGRQSGNNHRICPETLREFVARQLADKLIAKRLGCSRACVVKNRQRHGIPPAYARGKWPRRAALAVLLLLAGPAHSHSWYGELQVPGTGKSCCNEKDCAPAEPCVTWDGGEGLQVAGACRPIPPESILNIPSPDGLSHACYFAGRIQCTVLSGGS